MGKIGGSRNFGYGKSMAWAGKQALMSAYQGRFGTVAANANRWGTFSRFSVEQGVRDARLVTAELVAAFGHRLAEAVDRGEMKVSYAQNLLSSVNTTLSALRGDRLIRVSPSAVVGHRMSVRNAAPAGMDRDRVSAAVQDLRDAGHARAASVVELAREFGVREKEAVLMNLREARDQLRTRYAVDIREGTKGGRGRDVDRWVPASNRSVAILERAIAASQGARNLVPPGQNFRQVNNHLHHVVKEAFERHGLKGLHDLRAAYACERYQQLTGHTAPAVAGFRSASREADMAARETISQELGHERTDVLSAYVGSGR